MDCFENRYAIETNMLRSLNMAEPRMSQRVENKVVSDTDLYDDEQNHSCKYYEESSV